MDQAATDRAGRQLEILFRQCGEKLLDVRAFGAVEQIGALVHLIEEALERLGRRYTLAQLRPCFTEEITEIAGNGFAALLVEIETLVIRLVFQHQEGGDAADDAELLTVGCHQ